MRKFHYSLFFSLIVCSLLYSCGSSKKVSVVDTNREQVVEVPCSELRTDENFFRGFGIGQSKDLNTAREKARMNANAELASNISVFVKRVAEKYVNDAGQSPADYSGTFESMTREVVSQQMSNIATACNKTTQTQDGMYKVYMAVEAPKGEVFEAMDRRAEGSKKLETLFNREKFRKTFDEEMSAFAKENAF